MRFLTDQDVYFVTTRLLRADGHDVRTAEEEGLSEAPDETLLRHAAHENRILVTRDRDHGYLVFVQGLRGGVLYLRMVPSNQERVHTELRRVISLHKEETLAISFVVVQADKHRVRPLDAS